LRKTLNIVGCGNVGKALGRLWAESGVFIIQDVVNRSLDSARRSINFIGQGRAVASIQEIQPANVYLIGTPDDQIALSCETLSQSETFGTNSIVFHCSGALSSSILRTASLRGAHVASIHPIRSFANPEQVASSFAGTYCGVEGDVLALEGLAPAFSAIGAKLVQISAQRKSVYHAAAVFASNYLVTVLDVAVEAYAAAGVPRDVALNMMEPLVRGTVDNVFRLGPTDALTGPIARGDIATVVNQYRAINTWDKQYALLYKRLGKTTANIAVRKRTGTVKS